MDWVTIVAVCGTQLMLYYIMFREAKMRREHEAVQLEVMRSTRDEVFNQIVALGCRVDALENTTVLLNKNQVVFGEAHNHLVKGAQEIRDLLLDEAVPADVRRQAANVLNQIVGSL